MIVIVDDDQISLNFLKMVLNKEGYPVRAFDRAGDALAFLQDNEAWLIISDIRMPEMDGFEFQTAFSENLPHRTTPFIFLSSLVDAQSIIHGLDLGADDYLIKPVDPPLLQAKVRSILRRSAREKVAIFHGVFKKISFIDLLKFCESNGLTGEVEVSCDRQTERVQFNAGNIVLSQAMEDDDTLSRLYDLKKGTFRVYSRSVNFEEIEMAAAGRKEHPTQLSSAPLPMGFLSSIESRGRTFQAQTEYSCSQGLPAHIVTIITRGGKTLLKEVSTPQGDEDIPQLEQAIREQHHQAEKKFLGTIESAEGSKDPDLHSLREKVSRLFDQGFDRYRQGDFPAALAAFEAAKELDPENRTLDINLKVIRKKMDCQ